MEKQKLRQKKWKCKSWIVIMRVKTISARQCYWKLGMSVKTRHTSAKLHCVSKKSPFLFLWYLCQISSDSANFWQNHASGNLKQTHVHAQFISRFICSYCTLQKLSTRHNAHSDVGHFLFVFSLNRNVATSLKAYLNFLTLQPLSENSRINLLPPKT